MNVVQENVPYQVNLKTECFKPWYVEQCSLEVLTLRLLMVNLLQHQALGEERFAMVEEGFWVLIHELQTQFALGHLTLVPRPPHPLQNGPLGIFRIILS